MVVVATGAQNPTIDYDILNLKKPLLILDLSIPKNVNENVKQNPFVTLVHVDHLSQITDETLENRKQYIPAAEDIITEILTEFLTWSKGRKYAPTIHALKAKLNAIKVSEINHLKKKNADFNEEYTEIVTAKLIQKITSHFANHLKDDDTIVDESVAWINKVFQIEPVVK